MNIERTTITFKPDNVICRTGGLEENLGVERMEHVDASVTGYSLEASILASLAFCTKLIRMYLSIMAEHLQMSYHQRASSPKT